MRTDHAACGCWDWLMGYGDDRVANALADVVTALLTDDYQMWVSPLSGAVIASRSIPSVATSA